MRKEFKSKYEAELDGYNYDSNFKLGAKWKVENDIDIEVGKNTWTLLQLFSPHRPKKNLTRKEETMPLPTIINWDHYLSLVIEGK